MQILKTLFLTTFVMVALTMTPNAFAQQHDTTIVRSLGIDVTPVFSGGGHSILYQRNYKDSQLRVGANVGLGIQRLKQDQNNLVADKQDNIGLRLSVGRTQSFPIGKFNFVAGTDFFVSYNSTKATITGGESKNELFGGGINPVVGINYFVTPNFSLQLENLSLIGYQGGSTRTEATNGVISELTVNRFDFQLFSDLRIYARIHF